LAEYATNLAEFATDMPRKSSLMTTVPNALLSPL
jgi:hypothetical protein